MFANLNELRESKAGALKLESFLSFVREKARDKENDLFPKIPVDCAVEGLHLVSSINFVIHGNVIRN